MASIPSDRLARGADELTEPVRSAWTAGPKPDGCTPGPGQPCHDEPSGPTGSEEDVEADGGGGTPGNGNPVH